MSCSANPNKYSDHHTNRYIITDSDSDCDKYTNADNYSYRDTSANDDTNQNTYTNPDANTNAYGDKHSYSNQDAYANKNPYAVAFRYTCPNSARRSDKYACANYAYCSGSNGYVYSIPDKGPDSNQYSTSNHSADWRWYNQFNYRYRRCRTHRTWRIYLPPALS